MATPRQKGFLRLEKGSLGESTFVHSKDGYRVRTKKEISNKRWETDPQFARSRENAEDFGTGSTAAKLLNANSKIFFGINSNKIAFNRLKVFVSKLIRKDETHLRGKRNVIASNTSLLVGFELNGNASMRSIFNTRFSINGNKQTGGLGISIPSFIPVERIKAPKGTTHFKIIIAGSAIDFDKPDCERTNLESDLIEFNDSATDELEMSVHLPPNSLRPLFLYFGIAFMQLTMGEKYNVAQCKLNPVSIINVFI